MALCEGMEGVGAVEKGPREELAASILALEAGSLQASSHPCDLTAPTGLLSFLLLLHFRLSPLTPLPSRPLPRFKPSPQLPPQGGPPDQCCSHLLSALVSFGCIQEEGLPGTSRGPSPVFPSHGAQRPCPAGQAPARASQDST